MKILLAVFALAFALSQTAAWAGGSCCPAGAKSGEAKTASAAEGEAASEEIAETE
jgi:hypothetical protein